MTTDLELAEEIERQLRSDPSLDPSIMLGEEKWVAIIAALRRGPEPEVCPRCKGSGEAKGMTYGHGPDDYEIDVPCPACNGTGERPPSGERVMVPREPTRETILAINAAYWRLEEQTEIIGQGRASVDEHARILYRAMLQAAEASKEAK